MANQIVWCDIPVLDLDRAVKFYSAVLGQAVKRQDFPGMTIGILPHNDGEVGACLLSSDDEKPSDKGAMIYLNADGRLDDAIAAVVSNGGKIVKPKHAIGPFGFRARGDRQRGQSGCTAFGLILRLREGEDDKRVDEQNIFSNPELAIAGRGSLRRWRAADQ